MYNMILFLVFLKLSNRIWSKFQDGCILFYAKYRMCFQQDVFHLFSDGYCDPKNIDGSRQ